MDEREKDDPLRELGERLDKARRGRTGSEQAPAPSPDREAGKALGTGLRLGVELVAAVFVGAGLGWASDKSFGTRPWGIIVGFFVGIVVGMYEVFRVMMSMNAPGAAQSPSQPQGDWSDED
jgi:ATP synthase protein I